MVFSWRGCSRSGMGLWMRQRRRRSSSSTTTTFAKLSSSALVMRSEEHTSELQSLMRISYAVFCLKKKKKNKIRTKLYIRNNKNSPKNTQYLKTHYINNNIHKSNTMNLQSNHRT